MLQKKLYFILDNVKYNNNLGPIFRIADAVNVEKIFFCSENKTALSNHRLAIIKKSSRGSSEYVNWEVCPDTLSVVKSLKEQGTCIISIDIKGNKLITDSNINIKYPLAIVFGAEATGIDEKILDISDETLKIPMYGRVNSLNVASAVAIAAYKIMELRN